MAKIKYECSICRELAFFIQFEERKIILHAVCKMCKQEMTYDLTAIFIDPKPEKKSKK